MANTTTQTYKEFRKSAKARVQAANLVLDKQASFEATDPTCRGTVTIPDCGDGSNREKLNLPKNMTNYGEPDKMHNLISVTKPNGTGQGEYITPRNGTARDAAVGTFTAPMDKLADAAAELKRSSDKVQKQAQAPQQDVQMSNYDVTDANILSKLAGLGALALQHEEGRRTMQAILEKEAGIKEAQNIISQTNDMINKYANAQIQQAYQPAQPEMDQEQMQKLAAASLSHQAWLNQFPTEFEKVAYAQGALDGEQAAQALEAGQDPSASDVGELTDEDVIQTLQELVESGQISEEDVQALLSGVQEAGDDGELTPDEIAEVLQEGVQSGDITPEQAQAIAQAVLAESGGDAAAAAGPTPEEAAADPAVAKTASFHLQNTTNILNSVAMA